MIRDKKLEVVHNHITGGLAIQIHREEQLSNGQWSLIDPVAISIESAEFGDFAETFASSAVARAAQLEVEVSTLRSQRDEAIAIRAQLESRIAELESEVDVLRHPPQPTSVTPAQIRIWLLSTGTSLLDVDVFINTIEDPLQREEARVRWEYGLVVYRNDPLVVQFAQALGMTSEQMDAAFTAASQIQ